MTEGIGSEPNFIVDALQRYEKRLLEAKDLHVESPDSGRAGALLAIAATIEFIASVPTWNVLGLAHPLTRISGALMDLDEGAVDPVLRPTTPNGRPSDTHQKQVVTAYAAVSERLIRAGFKREEAAKIIAGHLHSKGFRQSGQRPVEAKTVAGWRDALKQPNKRSLAAKAYRKLLNDGTVFPDDKGALKRDILNRLTAVLQMTAVTSGQRPSES